jgi:hypothetical protein
MASTNSYAAFVAFGRAAPPCPCCHRGWLPGWVVGHSERPKMEQLPARKAPLIMSSDAIRWNLR